MVANGMGKETEQILLAINRRFYCSEAAKEFDAKRSRPWPGFAWLVRTQVPSARPVIEVGCGNGRFAAFLDGVWQAPFCYVGLDYSQPLLARARRRRFDWARTEFIDHDLSAGPWHIAVDQPFELAVLFGVLHHMPIFERRLRLLRASLEMLPAGGLLVATFFLFADQPRFRQRFVQFSDRFAVPASGVGPEGADPDGAGFEEAVIDGDDLEPGDHLLRWGAGEHVRYCHHADAAEREAVIDAICRSGAELVARHRDDGGLNEYVIWRRIESSGRPPK